MCLHGDEHYCVTFRTFHKEENVCQNRLRNHKQAKSTRVATMSHLLSVLTEMLPDLTLTLAQSELAVSVQVTRLGHALKPEGLCLLDTPVP